MQNPRRWRASHIILGLIVVAAGAYWIVQTIRRGAFAIDPGNAPSIVRSRPADGDREVAVDAKISATLNPGHSLDKDSLDHESVRLNRAADGQPVLGQIAANTAGDEIAFTPLVKLEAGTRYIFEVRGARDSGGAEVIAYAISFTTKAGE